ncbi:MAG: methyltransferase [Bacteroidales bacterium]|nr:methyltransferase [Bacteroidales bacterium]
MGEKIFKFKKFQVKQSDKVFKIGTDGVLLGAATDCENVKNILDVGTGTGLIAMMLAQKSQAMIYAIDINKDATSIAELNVANSVYADRIKIMNTSLQNFCSEIKFDLIVSNPPYFSAGVLAPDKNRAIARHNIDLNIKDLVSNSFRLLSDEGRIQVILPLDQAEDFAAECLNLGLFLKSKLTIIPKIGMKPVRVIIEMSKLKAVIKTNDLIIENNQRHDYTEEYKDLTRDYYLKF